MLDLDSGPVHLSVESGIGGTSLCLSLAAAVLEANSRVVWLGRTAPDPVRTRQILTNLNEQQLERLFIIEFGDDPLTRAKAVGPLISRLNESDVVIIDDWCPPSGRAPASHLKAARSIISAAINTRLVLTAKAYESPSGIGEPWRSRGEQLEGVRQTWLFRVDGIRNRRKLVDGELHNELELKNSGFSPA
jgi:hypothetical protein